MIEKTKDKDYIRLYKIYNFDDDDDQFKFI